MTTCLSHCCAFSLALALPLAAAFAQIGAPPAPGPRLATILGEVERGAVPLGEEQTILDVVRVVGLRRTAALERVTLLRPGEDALLVVTIDVLAMVTTGDTKGNVVVNDNDIVVVPARAGVGGDVGALLTDATLTALSDSKRAMLHAWCLENTTDARRLHDSIVELSKLGATGRVACQALARKLAGPPALAGEAAVALGMLGVAAAPALPALARHAAGPDKQLAARCKAAIRVIESEQANAANKKTPTDEAKVDGAGRPGLERR